MLYMVTFTINIPPMLAYIAYMDPMGYEFHRSPLENVENCYHSHGFAASKFSRLLQYRTILIMNNVSFLCGSLSQFVNKYINVIIHQSGDFPHRTSS